MRPEFRWLLITFLLLVAVGIRIGYGAVNGISHDEVISIVSAQGNVSRFNSEAASLVGKWVPASAWESFLVTPAPLSLPQIARDLGEEDTHPPLYFWLLRFWIDAFGIDSIRLMNLPFMALSGVFLYVFARRWLQPAGSILAVGIFVLLPAAVRTSELARPYEMLGLISILIAIETARIVDEKSRWADAILFSCIALIGMLTQYLAALVILTSLLILFFRRRRQLPRLILCLIASAVAFCLIHPTFYLQAGHSETLLGTMERVPIAAQTILGFIGWRRSWSFPYLDVAVLTVFFGIAIFSIARLKTLPLPVLFAILPIAATVLAFLALLLPSRGFGGRHLSIAMPFAALCLAMAAYRIAPKAVPILLAVVCIVAAPAELVLTALRESPVSRISTAPQIVTNNVAEGIILRYALLARDDARIFAAPDLIKDDAWRAGLETSGIIVLNPQYQDVRNFTKMKEKIEADYPAVGSEWGVTTYMKADQK